MAVHIRNRRDHNSVSLISLARGDADLDRGDYAVFDLEPDL
jgi:hypothetical protein